ncbi:unnamed protein product [Soboliphyme baturini]|uniref:Uncharacterized protein n=1 Tax=Soboliphyme baturini TaxID=241478 RepID=A0A183IBS1_9BILA|nr:unnamed protein product [Soboliphyme baturini]
MSITSAPPPPLCHLCRSHHPLLSFRQQSCNRRVFVTCWSPPFSLDCKRFVEVSVCCASFSLFLLAILRVLYVFLLPLISSFYSSLHHCAFARITSLSRTHSSHFPLARHSATATGIPGNSPPRVDFVLPPKATVSQEDDYKTIIYRPFLDVLVVHQSGRCRPSVAHPSVSHSQASADFSRPFSDYPGWPVRLSAEHLQIDTFKKKNFATNETVADLVYIPESSYDALPNPFTIFRTICWISFS